MANGNSFFAFVAGALTGAALLFLAKTEKGEEVVKDIFLGRGRKLFIEGGNGFLSGLSSLDVLVKVFLGFSMQGVPELGGFVLQLLQLLPGEVK